MRVIVTLATAGWRQWPDHVRQRALDLYPAAENVEFWDAGNAPLEGDHDLWGAWPRFCNLGAEALVADMVAEVLAAGDQPIALILILESLSDLTEAGSRSLLRREHLERLAEGLRRFTRLSRRIFRLGIIRSGAERAGQPDIARALIVDDLLDGVVFIDTPEVDRDVLQFDAVRLLLDAVRTSGEGTGSDWLRVSMAGGTRRGGIHWLHPPGPRVVALPGATQAAAIAAFIRPLTGPEGIDRAGQTLAPLDQLQKEINAAIQTAEARVPAANRVVNEDGGENRALIEAAGRPDDHSDAAVRTWWRDIEARIAHKYSRRPEDIDALQRQADPLPINKLENLEDLLKKPIAVASGAAGLTENARQKCEEMLEDIRRHRQAWGDSARREREEVDQLLQQDAALIAADGSLSLRSIAAYAALASKVDKLCRLAANMPGRRSTLAAVAGLVVALYVLLAVQTHGWAHDGDVLDAVLLGLASPRIDLLGLAAVAAALFRFLLLRRAKRDWYEACKDITDGAVAILQRARALVLHTMYYRHATEAAAGFAPIQARMDAIVASMREGRLRLLRVAELLGAMAPEPAPEEREKFKDRQKDLLNRPFSEWVRYMLGVGSQFPPEQDIVFSLGASQTADGEVRVRSRLRLSRAVQVEGL